MLRSSDAPITIQASPDAPHQTFQRSQKAQLLRYLIANRGRWVSFDDIHRDCRIVQVNGRISDLRRKHGVNIAIRWTKKSSGRGRFGRYQLGPELNVIKDGEK